MGVGARRQHTGIWLAAAGSSPVASRWARRGARVLTAGRVLLSSPPHCRRRWMWTRWSRWRRRAASLPCQPSRCRAGGWVEAGEGQSAAHGAAGAAALPLLLCAATSSPPLCRGAPGVEGRPEGGRAGGCCQGQAQVAGGEEPVTEDERCHQARWAQSSFLLVGARRHGSPAPPQPQPAAPPRRGSCKFVEQLLQRPGDAEGFAGEQVRCC